MTKNGLGPPTRGAEGMALSQVAEGAAVSEHLVKIGR
jgi:hypothetical protein